MPYGFHTVLPATQQRWESAFTPSRSRYSIKGPRRDARLSWLCCMKADWPGIEPVTCKSQVQRPTAEPCNTGVSFCLFSPDLFSVRKTNFRLIIVHIHGNLNVLASRHSPLPSPILHCDGRWMSSASIPMPSISFSRVDSTRCCTASPPTPFNPSSAARLPMTESISSINNIVGAQARAWWNT